MKRFPDALMNRLRWGCCLCFLIYSYGVWAEYQVTDGPVLNDDTSANNSAISPNGKFAAVGGESSSMVYIYNASSGSLYGTYQLPTSVESEDIEVTNNGRVIIGAQSDGVYCCDSGGNELWTQSGIVGEIRVGITPDGSSIYVEDYLGFYRLNSTTGAIEKTMTINTYGHMINGIECNDAGDRILLRTNSDVIIIDADGNEEYFYDIAAGNSLVNADISSDGTQFVVAYIDGTDHKVSLYTIGVGLEWTVEMTNFSRCRIDDNGLVYTSTQSGSNRIWSPLGNEIIAWGDLDARYIDICDSGARALCSTLNQSQVYNVKDAYTCYADVPLQAYLVDINSTPSYPTIENYTFVLSNWQDLPDELFVPAPELSPCGTNSSASRTYAHIEGDDGVQYGSGYCNIYDTSDFADWIIGLNIADPKPDHFKVVLWDRKCDRYYESNYMLSDHDCPIGDLNGDCIVNLLDLAILSDDWLIDSN